MSSASLAESQRLAALGIGLLARYVAIDLLFTTSPLYDPLVSAPEPGGRKVAHVAMLENEPGVSGLDWFHGQFAERAWRAFQPYYRWKVGVTDTDPADRGAKKALAIFSGTSSAQDCWSRFGETFAQLYCYFDANLRRYIPKYGPPDSVGQVFSYSTTPDSLGSFFGLLGFADDNWRDGTPTYEFVFGSSAYRELGYGLSSTVIHEFGHHLGMSHPHDGYDSESGADYDAAGETYFAWLGDESDTVMHYLSLSNGFGRHNQDNMYRWETAGYLNWANLLAGDLLASPEAPRAMPALLLADRKARLARGLCHAEAGRGQHRRVVGLPGRIAAARRPGHRTAQGRLPAAVSQGIGASRAARSAQHRKEALERLLATHDPSGEVRVVGVPLPIRIEDDPIAGHGDRLFDAPTCHAPEALIGPGAGVGGDDAYVTGRDAQPHGQVAARQ